MENPPGSYSVDMAELIDKEEEILADRFGVSIASALEMMEWRDTAVRRQQAEVLAQIIGLLIRSKNLPVMVHSLAIAFGLDSLNGAHSQSEIARQLGVTRALVSHYVLGWRDVLAGGVGAFDCLKFRKKNSTRKTYAEQATNPILEIKRKHRNERDH